MPENMQKLHLRNAVSANPEMASIGSFEATAQLINATANALTFDAYYETVLDAARRYDAAHAPRSGSGRTKKFVNFHDIDSSPEIEIDFLDGGDEDLYPEPNNLLAYSHQQFPIFAHDSNADSRFEAYQALQKQQWEQFKAQHQPHDPNFIPGNVWRQLPSWARKALQEKDRDQRASIAAQIPESDQRKVAYTDHIPNHLDTSSSESLEHQLQKWVLEHDRKERAIDDNARNDEQYRMQRSALVHEAQPPAYPAGDLRNMISSSHRAQVHDRSKPQGKSPTKTGEIIEVNGHRFVKIDVHNVRYHVTMQSIETNVDSLLDRGANGGFAGSDVRVMEYTDRVADVTGIENHQVKDLKIGTVAGVVQTQHGSVVIILHEYAIFGKGKTIHSAAQMEYFNVSVDDRSTKVGGKQRLTTLEGYVMPLKFKSGLPYLPIYPPTDSELEQLPHVHMTSSIPWDPTVLDGEIDVKDLDDIPPVNIYGDIRFDQQGNYRGRYGAHLSHRTINYGESFSYSSEDNDLEGYLEACIYRISNHHHITRHTLPVDVTRNISKSEWSPKIPEAGVLRRYLGWVPEDVVTKTIENTTQWGRHVEQGTYKKHFKSRFPAFNVRRRNEAVATDTFFADVAAVDDGSTCAQIFVGHDTLFTRVHGMKSEKDFVNVLMDTIRSDGAMDKLISDRAQVEISNKVLDILRNLVIGDWQSKPYYENQNPAERRYQQVKHMANMLLDRTGAPAHTWLLCVLHTVRILNILATESLEWKTPFQLLWGQTPDISEFFQFEFWEPVYFATGESLSYAGHVSFPSSANEEKGRFVGLADGVGDKFTYKVLTDDTNKIIYRSAIRSARDPTTANLRLSQPTGESKPIEIVKSPKRDYGIDGPNVGSQQTTHMATINPDELINKTYTTNPDDQGRRFKATVVRKVIEADKERANQLDKRDKIKFLVQYDSDEQPDQIVDIMTILDYVNARSDQDNDPEHMTWKYKDIIAHQGPLLPKSPHYKGSKYNVQILWEDGSKTFEPLNRFGKDDPVSCARYAKRNGLLDTDGWKQFSGIAKKEKRILRLLNQGRVKYYQKVPIYQYGYRVPRTPEEAIQIDKDNGNTKWQDAMALEMHQLNDYGTFTDMGIGSAGPEGYQKIRVHFVYAVKHDGRHKARLVAGGHLTRVPIDSVYSGVVSLRSLRLIIFLAELNGLDLWGADVGNAYLEAYTKEKVYIVAGKGFGELEGHTLIISKALYGLRSSGLRWHERFSDTLRDMKFEISKADPDVWMRKNGDVWEYIAVYVDDLAIAAKSPKDICNDLITTYKYKLKGVGGLSFHLGCDFYRDKSGVLCFGPKRYIDKMLDAYEKMFGDKPKGCTSPLERNDHPELDETEVLDEHDQRKYQSMIGALQWVVSLGRFDISTAVMTMSRFRAEPRSGHLKRVKRIYGYLRKFKDGAVRVRVGEPYYDKLGDVEHDWLYTTYGHVREAIPEDLPEGLGREVTLTTYVDANLYHDLLTGRSVTGILHFVNGTPIDWYSKRQATVETATYGSEFVAARIATDQIIDLRLTLRYLGVPIRRSAYMFGDNESVVTSSTLPHSTLGKRHNALSYHRVREAIAAKILQFHHISGDGNPSDILSKHCGHPQMWPTVRLLLFWSGDTLKPFHEEIKEEMVRTKSGSGADVTVAGDFEDDKEEKGNAVTRVDSGDRVTAKPEAAQKIAPREGECQRNNENGSGNGDWI